MQVACVMIIPLGWPNSAAYILFPTNLSNGSDPTRRTALDICLPERPCILSTGRRHGVRGGKSREHRNRKSAKEDLNTSKANTGEARPHGEETDSTSCRQTVNQTDNDITDMEALHAHKIFLVVQHVQQYDLHRARGRTKSNRRWTICDPTSSNAY
ncbi:hypothetical protein PENSPDRAFT_671438 [Peniophora sp. CONT]|nr:hypothetical protein PENSPDRAFT_671438 [Peniophora sp. CONT]